MNDAPAAFLNDLPGPVKQLPELAGYRQVEVRLRDAILRSFGRWHPPPAQRAIDAILTEVDALLERRELEVLFVSSERACPPWSAEAAELRFFASARALGLAWWWRAA